MAVGYGAGRYGKGYYGAPLSVVTADATVKAVSSANASAVAILISNSLYTALVKAAATVKAQGSITGSFGPINILSVSGMSADALRVRLAKLGPILASAVVSPDPTTVVSVTAVVNPQSDVFMDPVISVAAAALVLAQSQAKASGRGNYESDPVADTPFWSVTTPDTDPWTIVTDAPSLWKEAPLA
jgi:hypothetical protein